MSKQTRKRELERLRARREAERQRERRRRALLVYGGLALVVVVAAVAGGLWLTNDDDKTPAAAAATTAAGATTTTAPASQFNDARAGAPTAPAQVACGGKIPAKAPITTANFVFLAGRKFYDSTWFHRIVPGGAAGIAVIQGGDPEGSGRGNPGYAIKDELPSSPAAYKKYSVAMANSGPDTGGSQFFINFEDNSKALQANYSVFGEVTGGRDVVDKIAKVPVAGQSGDTPTQSVWIEHLTVKVS